jgi:hypothetical protein
MPPVTRKRYRPLRRDRFLHKWSGLPYVASGSNAIGGTQITVSEGHPWTAQSSFEGEDVGGDFYTISRKYGDRRGKIHDVQPQYTFGQPSEAYYYHGPLNALPTAFIGSGSTNQGLHAFDDRHFPQDESYSDDILMGYGSTAIARCKPTSSPANLSVGLAELFREGLPSLIGARTWETRAKDYRSSGDEFLNYQFGWLPLVSEIKDTANAIRNGNDLMKQYERDAGRLVRRGYEFPLEREVTTYPGYNSVYTVPRTLYAGWYSNGSESRLAGFREREITRKIWFKGAFTYYLPSDYASRSKVDRAALFASDILGLEITPETIWNLAPWSWAADWVTNIGDVMSNVSDFASDGLVLRYGYLMEHTIIKDTYTVTGAELKGYGPTTISNTFITEVKKRRRATPFGFGLDEGSFTPRQVAILAALGISRGPR